MAAAWVEACSRGLLKAEAWGSPGGVSPRWVASRGVTFEAREAAAVRCAVSLSLNRRLGGTKGSAGRRSKALFVNNFNLQPATDTPSQAPGPAARARGSLSEPEPPAEPLSMMTRMKSNTGVITDASDRDDRT
eukprot:1199294-Rhodomonas_salina.1